MSVETFPSSHEASDKDDKDSKREKAAPPIVPRWERPRILNLSGEHEGSLVELRPKAEAPQLGGPLLEGLVSKDEKAKDDKPERHDEAATEMVPNVPLPIAMEVTSYQPESDEDDDDEDEKPAQQAHAVQPEPTPTHAPEFEEIMQQLGPDYTEATSGDKLDDPHEADEEMIADVESAFEDADEDDDSGATGSSAPFTPFARRSSSGGGTPPPPPRGYSSGGSGGSGSSYGSGGSGSGGSGGYGGGGYGGGGGGYTPPPMGSGGGDGGFGSPGFGSGNVLASPAMAPVAELYTADALAEATRAAERRGFWKGAVIAGITVYAIKGYLDGRRLKRVQAEHQQEVKTLNKEGDARDAEMARLQEEQERLRREATEQAERYKRQQGFEQIVAAPTAERPQQVESAPLPPVAARTEAAPQPLQAVTSEALPPVGGSTAAERAVAVPGAEDLPRIQQAAEAGQLVDGEGNQIVLEPGWRVDRAAGGYIVVLDQHNRVVHNSVHYGKEFKSEQRHEQVSFTAFDTNGTSGPAGRTTGNGGGAGGAGGGGGGAGPLASLDSGNAVYSGYTPPTFPPAPMIPSGQANMYHELPQGMAPMAADVQHRLPKSTRSSIVSVLKSPWLWAAAAALLIVYFISALA